jgi:hypothetical protein
MLSDDQKEALSEMRDKDRMKWVLETMEALTTLRGVVRDLNAYSPPTLRELSDSAFDHSKIIREINEEMFALTSELEILLDASVPIKRA